MRNTTHTGTCISSLEPPPSPTTNLSKLAGPRGPQRPYSCGPEKPAGLRSVIPAQRRLFAHGSDRDATPAFHFRAASGLDYSLEQPGLCMKGKHRSCNTMIIPTRQREKRRPSVPLCSQCLLPHYPHPLQLAQPMCSQHQ